MKKLASFQKRVFRQLILVALLALFLLTPIYMYFSRNVGELKSLYPHAQISEREIHFTFRKEPPRMWTNLKQISRYGKWAIVLSEDWGFYQHEGIDLNQIQVALEDMISMRKFRGASTITQQLIKNLYLSEERTPWRKLHEMILAKKLEDHVTKSRILELYLNIVEFGPGIFGIKSASLHYFKKLPQDLNPKESAFLAMMLPSPKRYYISFKKKRLTKFAKARIEAILVKLRMGKVLTPIEFGSWSKAKLSWEK